ncbi:Uncharacterised protein [Mycobacteroides abscessus subsp. abscessus]|nr:Uncharacterised protein [Mycobacteroides abscessus subsp. abscessus]
MGFGDGVSTATVGECSDQLPVGEHQYREEHDDRGTDGKGQSQRVAARRGEHEDDRLRPIGDRRHRIQRERCQTRRRGQATFVAAS